jgi:hypothetical protein
VLQRQAQHSKGGERSEASNKELYIIKKNTPLIVSEKERPFYEPQQKKSLFEEKLTEGSLKKNRKFGPLRILALGTHFLSIPYTT